VGCVFYLWFFNYLLSCMCCVRLSYWIKITYLLIYLHFQVLSWERSTVDEHWYYSKTGCDCMGMFCEKKMIIGWINVWSTGFQTRGRPKRTYREVVEKDCQARKLNKEDAMDRSRWRNLIKDGWWSGWVWVGECFFWYRRTRVVPNKGPLNRCVCVTVSDTRRSTCVTTAHTCFSRRRCCRRCWSSSTSCSSSSRRCRSCWSCPHFIETQTMLLASVCYWD